MNRILCGVITDSECIPFILGSNWQDLVTTSYYTSVTFMGLNYFYFGPCVLAIFGLLGMDY